MADKFGDSDSSTPDYGVTTPNLRLPPGAGGQGPSAPPPPPSQPPPPSYSPTPPTAPPPGATPPKRGGIPTWLWIVGGSFLLLVAVAAVLFFFLLRQPGFIIVVEGAPPGSIVYVDNIQMGITSADGTIRVPGVRSGTRIIRVTHPGFEDFTTTRSGSNGEVVRVPASLTASGAQPSPSPEPAGLPAEIDYHGAMVLITAGAFTMGSDQHNDDERPAHQVNLPAYYIDRNEVTNRQYKEFCDAQTPRRPYPSNPWWDPSYFQNNPDAPVVGISYADAEAYARWAGKALPTEQQWEKAASWGPEGQKRMWPWGSTEEQGRANLGGDCSTSTGGPRPMPVGQNAGGASAYGVHDMAGNVAEWVGSFYQAYPGNQTSNANYGTRNRVVRGGHFCTLMADSRTTRRFFHAPAFTRQEALERSWLIGFRTAIAADDPRLQEHLRSRRPQQ